MAPLVRMTGFAAALPDDNIDTDIIFPARFLLITSRDGLGRYAFNDWRFAADGNEIADFVLNCAPWRDARFLVAGANFGSGSSREQAVWALLGRGIRCIIAPSFGEIFVGNCLRNGVLPVVMPPPIISSLVAQAEAGQIFTVDLEAATLQVAGAAVMSLPIDPEHRLALLNGWDDTAIILATQGQAIEAFEARQRRSQPWLYEAEV